MLSPASTRRAEPEIRNASMSDVPYNVLFICTGNSARSLFAEAIINDLDRARFCGYSAGSHPSSDGPHPYAIEQLERLNYDTSFARTKNWSEFAEPNAPKMNFVFTVCDQAAAEECPVWPGQPITAHWGVPNPVSVEGNEAERRLAFSEAYKQLRNRISIFVSLPIDTLDKFALQKRLDEIGETVAPVERNAPS